VVLTTYPTAGSAVLGVLGLFTVLYYQRKGKGTAALVTLLVFVPLLILTKTRASLIGFAVGWVASGLLFGSGVQRVSRMVVLALICAIVAFDPTLESTVQQAAEYRSGSTEERALSYRTGIEKTLAEDAVIGIGIKLMDESTMTTIGIPVGSHSTFVSLFVKGGIVGFTAAVMGLVVLPLFMWIRAFFVLNVSSPLQKKLKSEAAILFNLQCLLWFWMAFDDIDAPAFATVTTFVMYGYARGWCSRHLGSAGARRRDSSYRATGGSFVPRFATGHALPAE
jgi:O-antigen ligase